MKTLIQNPQGVHLVTADLFLKQIGVCKKTDICTDCSWKDSCEEKPEGFSQDDGEFFINGVEVSFYGEWGWLSLAELSELRQTSPRTAP